MNTPNASPADAYESVRPSYVVHTKKLDDLCRDLLKAKNIDFHLLESRTKEVSSFRDKVDRPNKAYEQPLEEITDLAALRIITYYQDAANEVAKLIREEFLVDEENTLEHKSEAAEFGYTSMHFVVKLNPARAGLLEWRSTSHFPAEIQVRTVLQHAWAAISHKLQYKREDDVPMVLKRKLFRLSALFELADDEFVALRDQSGQIIKKIGKMVTEGQLDLPIDHVSLAEFLSNSQIVTRICQTAKEAGFIFDIPPHLGENQVEEDRTLSDLIQLLTTANVRSIKELEEMLSSSDQWAKRYFQHQIKVDEAKSANRKWYVTPPFICQLVLIGAWPNRIGVNELVKIGYAKNTAERLHNRAAGFDKSV